MKESILILLFFILGRVGGYFVTTDFDPHQF